MNFSRAWLIAAAASGLSLLLVSVSGCGAGDPIEGEASSSSSIVDGKAAPDIGTAWQRVPLASSRGLAAKTTTEGLFLVTVFSPSKTAQAYTLSFR